MEYKNQLIQIGSIMGQNSQTLHKKLRSMPKGSLQVINDNGYIRINRVTYVAGQEKRNGIKKNPEMISGLAKKAFYKEYKKRLDYDINLLREAVKNFEPLDEESILKALPSNYELLPEELKHYWLPTTMHPVFTEAVPISEAKLYIPEAERDEWASKPYRANTMNIGTMRYKTMEGFRMRSKSEVAIFDIYKKHGIPIHYDELLLFNGVVKSPDFTAMRLDGKIVIHEHCGRVNDKEYMRAHYEKIKLYREFGFVPWDNLIITYDTPEGGIDLSLIEAEIVSKLQY